MEDSQIKQRQLAEFRARREKILLMGGKERVAAQEKRAN